MNVVTGHQRIIRKFQNMERNVQRKGARDVLKASSKIMQAIEKKYAPVGQKQRIPKAIKIRAQKKKRGSVGFNVFIDPKIAKAEARDTFIGAFLEFGTKAHKQKQRHRARTHLDSYQAKAWRIKPIEYYYRGFQEGKYPARDAIENGLFKFVMTAAR